MSGRVEAMRAGGERSHSELGSVHRAYKIHTWVKTKCLDLLPRATWKAEGQTRRAQQGSEVGEGLGSTGH